MSEDVARAVGARSADVMTIKGKEVRLRPLTVKELTELQRECVKVYRTKYLMAYKENLELLGIADAESRLLKKAEETAGWGVDDLPSKTVYDARFLPMTDSLRLWMKENLGLTDAVAKAPAASLLPLINTALDSETLSVETCKELTGKEPKKIKTGYANWWITASPEGMLAMVWACVGSSGLTKDELIEEIALKQAELVRAAREIEKLTVPEMGNGQAS